MKYLLIGALLLSGCATYQPYNGHTWPAKCTREALDAVKISVIEVDRVPVAYSFGGQGAYGVWAQRPSGNVIYLKRGLAEPLRSEVLDHERCHEIAGLWHGGEP